MTPWQEYRWLRRQTIGPIRALYIALRRAWWQSKTTKIRNHRQVVEWKTFNEKARKKAPEQRGPPVRKNSLLPGSTSFESPVMCLAGSS